jgi:hypothetical protein
LRNQCRRQYNHRNGQKNAVEFSQN